MLINNVPNLDSVALSGYRNKRPILLLYSVNHAVFMYALYQLTL